MTESEAQAEAARKAANRGCSPDCRCAPCISDDIDVAAARWGLNVLAIQASAELARSAVRQTSRPSGSGNGAGGRPARRRQPLPSAKQLDFIAKLWDEREFESPLAAQVMARESYEEDFDGRRASAFIDALMKLPRRGAREAQAAQVRARQELEVGRLYKFAGEIYRVRQGRGLYALQLLRDGGTRYAPGVVTKLDPSMALTLEEAQEWGRATGVCCQCNAELTNPESIALGIGPICRGKF